MTDQPPLYSPTVVEHFSRPRNVGRLEGADGIGRVDDRATDNLITIYLRLDGPRVVEARFRTLGCSACIAASSVATELIRGLPLAEALRTRARAILEALGGLPPDKAHCARLVARAVRAAAKMASERSGTG